MVVRALNLEGEFTTDVMGQEASFCVIGWTDIQKYA